MTDTTKTKSARIVKTWQELLPVPCGVLINRRLWWMVEDADGREVELSAYLRAAKMNTRQWLQRQWAACTSTTELREAGEHYSRLIETVCFKNTDRRQAIRSDYLDRLAEITQGGETNENQNH